MFKNVQNMEENYRLYANYDENKFASHGSSEGFEWFAYINHYNDSLFRMTEELKEENSGKKHHMGFRKQYFQAINTNTQFRKRVKYPFVVATGQFAPGGYPLDCFVDALREFFRTDEFIRSIPNNTPVSQVYKGKDLILPLVHADAESLDFMRFKAEQYKEMGCKSVTALFIYRIKPGIGNKYPKIEDYPYFSEYDFAGSIDSWDNSEGFLGTLVKGLEESRNNNVYIGGI